MAREGGKVGRTRLLLSGRHWTPGIPSRSKRARTGVAE